MTEDTMDRLRHLVRVNIDSSRGFERAAGAVERESLACLFRQIARDRRNYADRLRSLLGTAGRSTPLGTTRGVLRRWWLTAREVAGGTDDDLVLIEAERDEEAIERGYEASLPAIRDPGIRRLLRDQYENVKFMHRAVRGLRDLVAFESQRGEVSDDGPPRAARRPVGRLIDLPARSMRRRRRWSAARGG